MHMVLPPVLSVLDDRHAADNVREAALDTLILLANLHPVHERAPSIMQTWYLQFAFCSINLLIWDNLGSAALQ
jgi:hypothetical protein